MQRVDMRASIQFFWGFSKNACVSAWVMAIYAWRDNLWYPADGFTHQELEVDDLLWHAADAASAGGHAADGGTVSGVEPSGAGGPYAVT